MKVRYTTISAKPDIGSLIQTQWGNDLIHLKVESIEDVYDYGYKQKYICNCSIATIDLNYYEQTDEN